MKELIIVVCDTAHQAKRLLMDTTRQLIGPPVRIEKHKCILETKDYIFRFFSKYDMERSRGLKPTDVMTSYEFEQLIFGAHK